LYEYNFGDLWQLQVRIEERSAIESGRPYPVCVAGCWAGPPQDCGGPKAFLERRAAAPWRVEELLIEANQDFIPNYGDRYRHGEKISTAFAESAVNQVVSKRMVKKQQMRWSESGAHNLLQVRTKVFNDQLRETFVSWYGIVAPGRYC
jgi:hypothetical protein